MPDKAKNPLINQRRKPKQARALAKYNRVLDACSRVLATHGYADTTMTEIALESDLPYATIYQYFENKDAVFIAWYERMSERLFERLTNIKEMNPSLRIEEYVGLLVKSAIAMVAASKPNLNKLFYAMPHLLTSKIIASIEAKSVAMVQLMFSEEIKSMDTLDVDYTIKTLAKIFIGYLTQLILDPDSKTDIEKDGEELTLMVNLYLERKMFKL